MGFITRVKNIATGKNENERRQEAAANAEIRKKAFATQLREREKFQVKLAAEREKIAYENRMKALKKPKQSFFSKENYNYGSAFGQPRMISKPIQGPIKKKRKKKKGKYKVRYIERPQTQQQSNRIDVLGLSRF